MLIWIDTLRDLAWHEQRDNNLGGGGVCAGGTGKP